MKVFGGYLLRGLLFVFPIGITLAIIVGIFQGVYRGLDQLLQNWLQMEVPGLGIIGMVLVLLIIALFGYLVSSAFIRPLLKKVEQLISRMPFVNIIYNSFRELAEAFMGEERKFKEPVRIEMSETGLHKLGFLTKRDLQNIDIKELVAVYCPHSYNFSGNLFLVPKEKVTRLDVDPTEFMRFIVSGGITEMKNETKR